MKNYYFLLKTPLKNHWRKVGIKKRAGVVFPLFSVFSKNSLGIGEIPDLKLAIDWCQKTGNTILQLLPLNDSGFDFSPFNPQSSFALDPVYLSLRDLKKIKKEKLEEELKDLTKKFPLKTKYVNYQIKKEKLKKLWQIFLKRARLPVRFQKFVKGQKFWLENYALFRVLKEVYREKSWEDWPKNFRVRNKKALLGIKTKYSQELKFQKWLQWQLFEQLKEVKIYAEQKKVFLKGDLPFSVSRDSADVWTSPQYFKLNLASGAPPDSFSAKGQRWGYPPYNWPKILKDNFVYFEEKIKYLENFYHLFRLDHLAGLFRIWAIPEETPLEKKGQIGFFDPPDKKLWLKRGKRILRLIIKNTQMLPCTEDLGTLPSFSFKVLEDFGLPGIEVQRWKKDWKTSEFLKPQEYRKISVAALSTHDLNFFPVWWQKELNKTQKKKFLKLLPLKNRKSLIKENLKLINSASSIFVVLLIFEWLFLNNNLKRKLSRVRINKPGTISKRNFSLRLPIYLEELLDHPTNNQIKKIISQSGRAC